MKKNGNATSSDDILVSLDENIARYSTQRAETDHQIRDFMAREDPRAGIVYAQEIFHLQREKLRLQAEIELLTRKKNRFLLGL